MNTQKAAPTSRLGGFPASPGFPPAAALDPARLLSCNGIAAHNLKFNPKQAIFVQGDPADAVFYIQSGRVRVTAVSNEGKEATLALLGAGEFLGEYCMSAEQPTRVTTAVAITDCAVLKVSRGDMASVMRRDPRFLDFFLSFVLSRNVRMQEDLLDQLFNSSEKRLARTLLLLADFRDPATVEAIVPKISHEVLAAMVGTTRSRVSFFMNRFRKQGLIHYCSESRGGLMVRRELINVLARPSLCAKCGQRSLYNCVRCSNLNP